MNLLPPTRREFLILAGLATGKLGLEAEPLRRGSYLLLPATTGSEQARPGIHGGFASLAEVFAAPCSPFFGVRMESRVESFLPFGCKPNTPRNLLLRPARTQRFAGECFVLSSSTP
jgi:hypothetical protein